MLKFHALERCYHVDIAKVTKTKRGKFLVIIYQPSASLAWWTNIILRLGEAGFHYQRSSNYDLLEIKIGLLSIKAIRETESVGRTYPNVSEWRSRKQKRKVKTNTMLFPTLCDSFIASFRYWVDRIVSDEVVSGIRTLFSLARSLYCDWDFKIPTLRKGKPA